VTAYVESARPKRGRRVAGERRTSARATAGGIVWIGIVAALLAGVVVMNVALLRVNMRLGKVSHQRADLQSDVARLQSALSSAAASPRIMGDAQRKLGLVEADANTTAYVQLP
jgi:cell division protein FtsL